VHPVVCPQLSRPGWIVYRHVYTVTRFHVVSNPLMASRGRVLLVILLLTANFVGGHYHVTRAESYPQRVHRSEEVEDEKLPDTNGMFFGKRSTAAAAINTVKSPAPQDTPFLPLLQRNQNGRPCLRREGARKSQPRKVLDHGKKLTLEKPLMLRQLWRTVTVTVTKNRVILFFRYSTRRLAAANHLNLSKV